MFYIMLFIVNFILIWLCLSYKIKKVGLIAAIDIFSFFSEYVLVSGFLFWFNCFSVIKAIVIMLILNAAAFAVFLIKYKKIDFHYEKISFNIPLIAVILIAIPFSLSKFGYFGMGQDQGVYQVKAVDLMHTDTLRVKTFDEYQELDHQEQSEYFQSVKGRLQGYDIYDIRKPYLESENKISDVDGVFHGIPTFPAILALSGKMFGVENISALNSLIYLGIILLMNYLCSNFKLKKANTFLTLAITALSPIVIWVMKSTLTELFLTLIFISFLYFITAEDSLFNIVMSVVSIAAFSFFHVTIYTMMPFFILCYLIKYLKTGNIINFFASVLSAISIIVGLNMMLFVSPTYTTNNIVKPINLNMVNDHNCILIIAFLALFFLLIFGVIAFIKPIKKFFIKFIKEDLFIYIFRIICIITAVICIINCVRNKDAAYNIAYPFETNSLVAFAYLTGIVVLPVALVLLIKKFRSLALEQSSLIIVFAFFYCVLFRSAFLSKEVLHYYYYARYLAPYIPIVALLCGIVISKKIVPYIVTFASVAVMLPYDLVMFQTADDTRVDWENVLDITEYIDENDAVIVDSGLIATFFIPIREMTGADMYPVFSYGLNDECAKLSAKYEDVFFLTDNDAFTLSDNYYSVYNDVGHESQDIQEYHNKMIPLPYKFYSNDYNINLLKYTSKNRAYDLQASTVITKAFSNDAGFSWSLEENSEITLPLIIDEPLNAIIYFKNIIPFSKLEMDNYDVKIYVNNEYYCTVDLTKQMSVLLTIPPNTGTSKIQFSSQLWSPSWIGQSDSRMLGFALEKVSLSKYKPQLTYSFKENNIISSGFGAIENNNFSWSNSEKPEINCLLEQKDYTVDIKCSPLIDLDKLGVKTYVVSVYMNGKYVGVMKLGKNAKENEHTFKIPADTILTENNVLSFSSELWIPAELGINSDQRQLGFALESVTFKES